MILVQSINLVTPLLLAAVLDRLAGRVDALLEFFEFG